MKRIISTLLALTLLVGFSSCNDKDDEYYVSVSGEGAFTINNNVPYYLYRMSTVLDATTQEIYLMGGSAHINGDGDFRGRGASVKIMAPNSDEQERLQAMSFDIDNSDYVVSYSPYVSYENSANDAAYSSLVSGTVIIRRSGSVFDVRILGIDEDDNSVIISYRGYIYRAFYDEGDDPEVPEEE